MELNIESLMRGIFKEFKSIDAFRTRFKNDFFEALTLVIKNLYSIPETEELVEFIDMMAEETMRFADAVVEKDRTYPEYRQELELRNFNMLLDKQSITESQSRKIVRIKYETNLLLLKYYPAIFELSSFGYRLLDRNVHLFACQFANAMLLHAKKQSENTLSKKPRPGNLAG